MLDSKLPRTPSRLESTIYFSVSDNFQITFSYSVKWEASDIRWASRWDSYLGMGDVQIHWFSIVNSIVVVLFLSGILTMIIIRTLRSVKRKKGQLLHLFRRDIAAYNREDLEEELDEAIEETGWKLVHGDVFRAPEYPRLLCSLLGSGVQIFCMLLVRKGRFVEVLNAFLRSRFLSPCSACSHLLSRRPGLRWFRHVHANGISLWLLRWALVQNYRWQVGLESVRFSNRRSLSWNRFWNQFHSELFHLGQKVVWGSAVYDDACDFVPLVWSFCPFW